MDTNVPGTARSCGCQIRSTIPEYIPQFWAAGVGGLFTWPIFIRAVFLLNFLRRFRTLATDGQSLF
jgi:hypothetical protein